MVLIAHLCDLHLDGTARAHERARRVIDHVRSLAPAPDLVLVSGDVADQGDPEQYRQAQDLLAGLEALVLPGNHDRRRPMRAWLGLPEDDQPISDVRRFGDVTVIGADSTVPGQDHGRLAEPCRALIETEAARPGPLLVALHENTGANPEIRPPARNLWSPARAQLAACPPSATPSSTARRRPAIRRRARH